jgi:hypothetical protein
MGGYARSQRRTVIGLDHRLGPIQKKYGWESTPGFAAKLRSLMGTSDHHVAGKEPFEALINL